MVNKNICLILGIVLMLSVVSALPADPSVIYPQETNYGEKVNYIKWSYTGELNSLTDYCWYSLNGGDDWTKIDGCETLVNVEDSGEGDNVWKIKLNDTEGASQLSQDVNFWVDSIKPNIIINTPDTFPAYLSQNYFNIETIVHESNPLRIYFSVIDNEEEISVNRPYENDVAENFRYPNAGSVSDGMYEYTIRATDSIIGNEDSITQVVYLDTVTPTITDNAPEGWQTNDVVVTLTPSDSEPSSGISKVETCTGGDCSWEVLESPYQKTYSNDGVYNVLYRTEDNAGNIGNGEDYTIMIDTTAPETTDNYGDESEWHNAGVEVTLETNDATSGVDKTYYKIDSGDWQEFSESITINTEGIHTLEYYSIDIAGNEEEHTVISVKIDLTAPETTINSPEEYSWQNKDFELDITDIDDLSGVYLCNFSVNSSSDGGETWDITHELSERDCNTPLTILTGTDISNYCETEGENACKIKAFAINNAGNEGNSIEIIFNIDWTAPIITLNGDAEITIEQGDSYTELGSTWTDNIDGEGDAIIGGDEVDTETLGDYIITYDYIDNAGNIGETKTRTVHVVDTTNPLVNILETSTSENNNTGKIQVNIELTETNPLTTTYELYNSDTDELIESVSYNPIQLNHLWEELDDGNYNYKVLVEDTSGNTGQTDYNQVYIDTTTPSINLFQPDNNVVFNWKNNDTEFTAEAVDLSDIDNCYLILDGDSYSMNSLAEVEMVATLNIESEFSLTHYNALIEDISTGTHSWYVICNDTLGNENSTKTRQFTILSELVNESEFTNYTNLTQEENISNVSYFFVENLFGKINFTEAIDFSSGFDWTKYINISDLHIYVNSTFDLLNKPAILTFYNVTFTRPDVLKDGKSYCDSGSCYEYNKTNNTLTIEVNGFTDYTVIEYVAPVKKNVYSGGSGGGGGSSPDYWKCIEWEDWSECENGTQIRECLNKEEVDSKLEETPLYKEQSCEIDSDWVVNITTTPFTFKDEAIEINLSKEELINFNVKVIDNKNETFNIEWFLNDLSVGTGNSYELLSSNLNNETSFLEAKITSKGFSETREWKIEVKDNKKGFITRITGGAINVATSKGGIISIIIIGLIVAGFVGVNIYRKKKGIRR